MPTEYVYIHNISDSSIDLATTGVFLDKNAVSKDSYDAEELKRSSEIRKFVHLKMIELLTEAQYDKFIQKQDFEKKAAEAEQQEQEFYDTQEPPKGVTEAFANVENALRNLRSLVEGKAVKVYKKRGPKPKNAPPAEETEKAQGTSEEVGMTDAIPDQPATGMEPMNDPVKKLLGRPPYSKASSDKEIKTFIMGSMDLGMLRELATFLKPGELKTMAKRKYREASAVLGG